MIPEESIDFIAGLIRATEAPNGTWYVGLFENNYVPDSASKAADIPATIVECTAYSEAARPAWNHAYDGTSVLDNLASKAQFTFSANKRLYGAFVISTSTKGAGSGRLLQIARFATPIDVVSGEVFSCAAILPLISTSL